MTHSRRQMRACALAWRMSRLETDRMAALLWRQVSLHRRIRIPVQPFDAPCFLVPVPGANQGRRA